MICSEWQIRSNALTQPISITAATDLGFVRTEKQHTESSVASAAG
jgi:hypothetical protein